LADDFSIIECF
jgi:hypothetical protein